MNPVARKGDLHSCPIPGHGITQIITSSPSQVEGQPVARVGDKTSCGATIVEGSSHSHHDGRPTAYLGCKTDHGGEIITASSSAKVAP